MKTNKSFTKRLKITKNGKVVGRKPGQNHFNAKESRSTQMAGNRSQPFVMSKKVSQRFIKTATASKN
jgi:ribosomal protein L35